MLCELVSTDCYVHTLTFYHLGLNYTPISPFSISSAAELAAGIHKIVEENGTLRRELDDKDNILSEQVC